MATVVQIVSVDVIVFRLHPTGRVHTADAVAFIGGHNFLAAAGQRHTATSECIQFAVKFKTFRGDNARGEVGFAVLDDCERIVGI